jgi:hypothetical protein
LRRNPLNSDRESIERGQGLREQINVLKINGFPQIRDLVVPVGFIDIDILGLRTALVARTPAIAALFEFAFAIERGLFSPDPNGLSAGVL